MTIRSLDDADVRGRRVLVRVDFNLPMAGGRPTDDSRLRAALPTLRKLKDAGAKIILVSHLGRPRGRFDESMSLRPLAAKLAELLGSPVAFGDDCAGPAARKSAETLNAGDVLLLENLRFHPGEEANDSDFAAELASMADLYVADALSVCHRAHASTEAIAHLLPSYAGEGLKRELEMLDRALGQPRRPLMGLVGGAKISTKLRVLRRLVTKLETLVIGGGMANTFILARGQNVGASLCEPLLAGEALEILAAADAHGCEILLPDDVVVEGTAGAREIALAEIKDDERIMDVGSESLAKVRSAMDVAVTLIWNGPLGVFETPPFDAATTDAARYAASLVQRGALIAIAGGGDTVAALNHAGVTEKFSFVSNAGGAFLEWMEGRTLPGLAALNSWPDEAIS
ncbi:MAG: phosphoglycerate kinase [Caulobacteraceae bacterium]